VTAARVALAFALAFILVPSFGRTGAAAGLVAAEWLLLLLGRFACARAGVPVPVLRPLASALVACVPMAAVLAALEAVLPLGLQPRTLLACQVGGGALVWVATVTAAAWLAPARVRRLTGDFRYP
jgi:hypothetical protein